MLSACLPGHGHSLLPPGETQVKLQYSFTSLTPPGVYFTNHLSPPYSSGHSSSYCSHQHIGGLSPIYPPTHTLISYYQYSINIHIKNIQYPYQIFIFHNIHTTNLYIRIPFSIINIHQIKSINQGYSLIQIKFLL